jgi:hypothetical protein
VAATLASISCGRSRAAVSTSSLKFPGTSGGVGLWAAAVRSTVQSNKVTAMARIHNAQGPILTGVLTGDRF